jgi:1-aminocyclopropane-1-carboxylate deaminase/D-cysteine desulfhydrase-like pyridoxal-dependent ACC family enzyme
MKKLLLLFAVAFSATTFAQSTLNDDIDVVQSVYGKSKSELVSQYMALSGEQAATFTKIYDAYEVERKKLGEEKIHLINQYATDYAVLTDEKADAISKGALKNNLAYDKLYSTYYDKVKKAIGATNATKFIQLEIYLQTEIRSSLQNAIPFVGELELSKVKKQ